MLVNSGVARFQHYARETVAQTQESLHTFQRIVGLSRAPQLISLIEATRQRVDFVLSQCKPHWHAFRQRTGEALSRQSHLGLLATRARDGVYPILVRSKPFLHRIRHLHGTTKNRKAVPTLIGAAFAGLALIILLSKMGMSNQTGDEHAGSVKNGATSSLTQVPDWTIFDDAFANQPTRRATSEFEDRVRTSDAASTPDPTETTGRVMREPVPLPRPRPTHR
jgi:hypothetical protein